MNTAALGEACQVRSPCPQTPAELGGPAAWPAWEPYWLVLGSNSERLCKQQQEWGLLPGPGPGPSFHTPPRSTGPARHPSLTKLLWCPTAWEMQESRHLCPTSQASQSRLLLLQRHLGHRPLRAPSTPGHLQLLLSTLNFLVPGFSVGCSHLPKYFLLSNLYFYPAETYPALKGSVQNCLLQEVLA